MQMLRPYLPRTWSAFFGRYGNFTPTQLAAIPALLDGKNIMLCAPTASGKTAAILAPLIERHCPAVRPANQISILYLMPTRALVNDLQSRLTPVLEQMRVTLAVKTGDSSLHARRIPDLLLSTPESLDSLLTSRARLFSNLHAIVIDELHLFSNTARGDQLRVLLNRIRRIRSYAASQAGLPESPLQIAALSATSAANHIEHYVNPVEIIRVLGGRVLEAEYIASAVDDYSVLRDYLASFRRRGWRKALVFCNSRAEVEAHAAAIRADSPFGSAVYVHYSNLEPQRRRAIETEFASNEVAICFSSSTLELGIDIGSIDVVILIGPPGNVASFAQRIGRGNRRQGTTPVACLHRSELERLLFKALIGNLEAQQGGVDQARITSDSFRPSVAIQQIFSLIKQSPIAAVRLAELNELFHGMLSADDIRAIVAELRQRNYLREGRPGEWKAGPRLNKLYDEQTAKQVQLSIYSNIQVSAMRLIEVRDQHTDELIAKVESSWFQHQGMSLEGRPINVEWYDGDALWVSSARGQEVAQQSGYPAARQLLSYELARLLPGCLGLPADTMPYMPVAEGGYYYFHWLGDLYGQALLDLLSYRILASATQLPGLALHLPEKLAALPEWTEAQVTQYLRDSYRQYERLLELGPFQKLLPMSLRRRSVIEHFQIPRFLEAVQVYKLIAAPDDVDLEELIG